MPPRVVPALLLLALLLPFPALPSAAQASGAAASATGPDADGAFLLRFPVERAQDGPATLALGVVRSGADGDLAASRDLGAQALAAGANDVEVSFLPAEGPGRYEVTLHVDGQASGAVSFDVDDAAAAGTVRFDVADEPTWLNLTTDDVNAPNKTKSPGEALVTRARLADGNGLVDVHAVVWRVVGPGGFADAGTLPVAADLELRYDRAPLPAGDFSLTLAALRGDATLASATRTFRIREVAPTLLGGALPDVAPDEARMVRATLVLGDRNGFPTAPLEVRLYRASTRVEPQGFAALLGTPAPMPDLNGSARAAFPLDVSVPARATPGAYRASVYADGALLGSMPFAVLALPALASVEAATESGALRLTARGTGEGLARARLGGVETSAAFVNGSATLLLVPAERNASLAWELALHARDDGPPLASRNGTWTAPFDGPALSVTPLHVRRLPAAWRVGTAGADDLAGANATFTFARWDGAPEPRLVGRLDGDRARVEGPRDLPAGRYQARLVLAWPNGSASEATWSLDAGPWVQLALGAAVVDGRVARVPIVNEGGVVVRRLVVETDPASNVTLETGNATLLPAGAARTVFSGLALAPGEGATLRVELPAGALASGRHDVRLRVLARVELP